MGVSNTEKLSKSLLAFLNTLEFLVVFEKQANETTNVEYVTRTLLFGKLKL